MELHPQFHKAINTFKRNIEAGGEDVQRLGFIINQVTFKHSDMVRVTKEADEHNVKVSRINNVISFTFNINELSKSVTKHYKIKPLRW